MEPSDGVVEAGCQGTLRFDVLARGSARTRRAVEGRQRDPPRRRVQRLTSYDARKPVIDGLEYHEGMNAVRIAGGVATNVIPDECRVTVNYRFAPDLSEDQAWEFAQQFFDGYELELTDPRPGALPGPVVPAAAAFVAAVGGSRTRSSAGPTSPASPRSASPR